MGLYSFSADRTGLEPATSAVTGQHSNQLNYRSLFDETAILVQLPFSAISLRFSSEGRQR